MTAAAVIGIDGGGTHSRGVLLSVTGEVLALESSGPSNALSVGVRAAGEALSTLVSGLLAAAKAQGCAVVAGGYGLSGLDRPKDEAVLTGLLTAAGATGWPYTLVNDAYLALRAGTLDGVGVAVVSGTGCNTVGVDARGRHERVGGLSWEFGDFGGADDLGTAALRAAMRGEDGRAPRTALAEALRRALEVSRLDDLLDCASPDAPAPMRPGSWAPLVFEVAQRGDATAQGILRVAGQELGFAARLVAERLFLPADPFPLVLGGRVLVEGACDVMRDALVAEVRSSFANVQPVRLAADPVLGAALLAIDRLVDAKDAAAPRRWPDAAVARAAGAALAARSA